MILQHGRVDRPVRHRAISVLTLVSCLAIGAGCSDDSSRKAVDATTPSAVTAVPTTGVGTTAQIATTVAPTTTVVPAATVPPPTTAIETTTTIAPVVATTVVPATVTPVVVEAAASVPQCSDGGALSIASIDVLQPILVEARAFSDGLLCGNHRSDGVTEGVDILPGFASVEASAEGGSALVGQVPAIIFGHRKSHNRPFYKIDKLRAGDSVVVHRPDGSEIHLQVSTVELHGVRDATNMLLSPSQDGVAQVRLVACAHADGTPGGINYRWIATLVPAA